MYIILNNKITTKQKPYKYIGYMQKYKKCAKSIMDYVLTKFINAYKSNNC